MDKPSSLATFLKIPETFPAKEAFLKERITPSFAALSPAEREEILFRALLELIDKAPAHSFLLNPLLDFIVSINERALLPYALNFASFESWLNQRSALSKEKRLIVRGKIAGKYLPRAAYQAFFPIGGGKSYEGDHYVAAHLSPDIDTLTASFWGWLDAFAAELSEGVHYWHLPEGAPDTPFSTLFAQYMGSSLLKELPHTALSLPALKEGKKATLSLRDFSNFDEIKMEMPLALLSVVDHHKSSFSTPFPSTIITADVQSCNILMAEEMFKLNDRYGIKNKTVEEIGEEIHECLAPPLSPQKDRFLQRLFQKRSLLQQELPYFVHPKRAFSEYLTFLYAIMDDTDLMTKVTERDVDCLAELLNRLQSLAMGKEVEIIDFSDLPRDESFVKRAAERILQNREMYALYKEVYSLREKDVEKNIEAAGKEAPSNLFTDTKVQNGCSRVGQTKLFNCNFASFSEHASQIRASWIKSAKAVYEEKREVDFHLQMISTIPSAEEVHASRLGPYLHRDELWFWVPEDGEGLNHLRYFLEHFVPLLGKIKESLSIEVRGSEAFSTLFGSFFPAIPLTFRKEEANSLAILRFQPGALNSRKAMITPFLPKLKS